jgi:hypothetical protein
MTDPLELLIRDAKKMAEGRGLHMVVYLLSLAELELERAPKPTS